LLLILCKHSFVSSHSTTRASFLSLVQHMSVHQPGQPFRCFYGRKSRLLGDPENLDVFAHQINPLLRRAEAEGRPAKPEEIVVEVGSGETIADRPEFAALLAQIEALRRGSGGEFWVWEIARLSRGDELERARIGAALRRAGVTIVTERQRYDLLDPAQSFLFSFQLLQAEFEVSLYKKRVADKRRELILAGEILTGLAPWGYLWDKNPLPGRRRGQLVPDPERFPLLKQVCREVLTVSVERLGRRYGVPKSTLTKTLRNPAICGYPAWRHGPNDGRRPANRKSRILLPRGEWLMAKAPGDWPPACTKAEWEAIQATLDRRDCLKGKTLADEDGWCVDIVRFAGLDRQSRRGSVGSGARSRPTYEVETDGKVIWCLRQPVHEHATLVLGEALKRTETLAQQLALYRERMAPGGAVEARETDLIGWLREREEREKELDALLLRELRADPEEAASIARVRAGLKAEVKRLTQAIQHAEQPAVRLPALEEVIDLLPGIGAAFAAVWPETPGAVKRQVAAACIQSLTVTVERDPKHRGRYLRTYGPTLFQDWLPWGRHEE
jgi:DNA invertase Pin-like site-specific DNA recombinase